MPPEAREKKKGKKQTLGLGKGRGAGNDSSLPVLPCSRTVRDRAQWIKWTWQNRKFHKPEGGGEGGKEKPQKKKTQLGK